MEEKIESLLSQMTLEEKVSMLAGASMWYGTPVERLDIPALKMTDGPNGARGGGLFAGGVKSACFPVGISLASTWNIDLVERIGVALGEEAKSKGAHILLAPTVNIHRSPLNGRNFECYSEDPYLSARIAVAYINGVQSQGVGTSIKHYVCNDSEFERNSINVIVGERALRELYLPPFKAAVQEAGTWSVMAAYNKVNGTFASENPYTLIDILKQEWGFDGFVVSDWFGSKSTTESVNGGLDMEMPGPPVWRGEKLLQAAEANQIDLVRIDDSVRRMLRVTLRAGVFDNPEDPPEQAIDKPEHRSLIREAAAEGIVLLKNENNVLPLSSDTLETLAVIGPNAAAARVMGGGSARVNAHYLVTPYDGIVERVGKSVEINYEMGCTNHKMLPVISEKWLTPANNSTNRGLTVEYFNNLDLSGEPVLTDTVSSLEQIWLGQFAPEVDPAGFSARLTGTFTAPESGRFAFSLVSVGLSRLYIDGELVIDNWTDQQPGEFFFGMGSQEVLYEVDLAAGQSYALMIEYSRGQAMMLSAVRLGYLAPVPADSIDRAAKLAAQSEVAVVFVGLTDEWESEGQDRPDMELAGDQIDLIRAVAAANVKTVVVLQTGSPVSMPWLDEVDAVLQAWYPGQECGNAIADVLFGDVNPSGKLTQTFPKQLEDNPAFLNYPGENGNVLYGEGLFVGYRYYDKKKIEPLFPFGHGLSYTTFEYSELHLSADTIAPDDDLYISFDVINTGDVAGQEIVQLYICDPESSLVRPERELKAFAKLALEPGETQTVRLTLNRESLAYYDDLKQTWVAEAGAFEILVGSSLVDIRATATFNLRESVRFGGPEKVAVDLNTKSTLQTLLNHDGAKAILEKYLGDMMQSPQMGMAMGFSLQQMAGFAPDMLTDEVLATIEAELAAFHN